MSKYQSYYKETIAHFKEELRKVYVTAIADLMEENVEKAEQLFVFRGDIIVKEPLLVWADEYHINTNETEVVVETQTMEGLVYQSKVKLCKLSNDILEMIYNELAY